MIDPLELATQVATRLGEIDGIVAVVLGGSHARGGATPASDIDLGLYYDPAHKPDIGALRRLAAALDDRHSEEVVTNFGDWGPWINGGGWLNIDGQPIDWLFCDVEQIEHELAECEAGRVRCYYQPGHPHGFYNHIYVGQVFFCKPLFERDDRLQKLKARTTPYPPGMKRALIGGLWEAGFSLDNTAKPASRNDVTHVVGLLYRAVSVMTQALFALNERFCMNEKGAVAQVNGFPLHPPGYQETVTAVLGNPGNSPEALKNSVKRLESLLDAVQTLCGS